MEIEGVSMNILDRDRLICECLKYEADMDNETFNKPERGAATEIMVRANDEQSSLKTNIPQLNWG